MPKLISNANCCSKEKSVEPEPGDWGLGSSGPWGRPGGSPIMALPRTKHIFSNKLGLS